MWKRLTVFQVMVLATRLAWPKLYETLCVPMFTSIYCLRGHVSKISLNLIISRIFSAVSEFAI